MSPNILSFLSVALVSALLAAGPAFASPNDGVRAGQRNRPPHSFQPGSRPAIQDEARRHMRSEPEWITPDRHPGWNDGQRPMPQRWNDERPASPMPPRQHYQPEPRGQHMRPMPATRSSDDTGRLVRPHRDDIPSRPGQPERTGSAPAPFRYHR